MYTEGLLFLKFMVEMLKEKTREKIEADQVVNEDQLSKEFLSLWKDNQIDLSPYRVLLLVTSFFDMDGSNFMQGGAERYTLELNRLITIHGGKLEVYQCGSHNWYRYFSGISVYGLSTNGFHPEKLNRYFHKWVPKGALTIYYQMVLSTPAYHIPSICVSHGVDWDAHWLQNKPHEYDQTIQNVLSSIRNHTHGFGRHQYYQLSKDN